MQAWDAGAYARNARFVSDLGDEILRWLDPKPGERVLDLGCGDGVLTEKIKQAGAFVLGIDTSPDLLSVARARGLDVRCQDAQELTFDSEFDAVFSNAALHWMTKPERVVAGVAAALRPGGRFVAEFGGHGNVAAILTALRSAALALGGDAVVANPWYFPTAAEYEALLHEGGFTCERIEIRARPTPLPTGIEGWLETFCKPFFDHFDGSRKKEALRHIVELLGPSLCDGSGTWTADYVRLRVAAKQAGR